MKQLSKLSDLINAQENGNVLYMQSVTDESEFTLITDVIGDSTKNGTFVKLRLQYDPVFTLFEYVYELTKDEMALMQRRNTAIRLIGTYQQNIDWLNQKVREGHRRYSVLDMELEETKLNKAIEVRNEMNQKLGL